MFFMSSSVVPVKKWQKMIFLSDREIPLLTLLSETSLNQQSVWMFNSSSVDWPTLELDEMPWSPSSSPGDFPLMLFEYKRDRSLRSSRNVSMAPMRFVSCLPSFSIAFCRFSRMHPQRNSLQSFRRMPFFLFRWQVHLQLFSLLHSSSDKRLHELSSVESRRTSSTELDDWIFLFANIVSSVLSIRQQTVASANTMKWPPNQEWFLMPCSEWINESVAFPHDDQTG